MSEQSTAADRGTTTHGPLRGRWINDEFVRRYREAFDRAERTKGENNRRLEARLAELRAQRAAL